MASPASETSTISRIDCRILSRKARDTVVACRLSTICWKASARTPISLPVPTSIEVSRSPLPTRWAASLSRRSGTEIERAMDRPSRMAPASAAAAIARLRRLPAVSAASISPASCASPAFASSS